MFVLLLFLGVFLYSQGYVNIALNKPTHQQYPYLTARSNFHPSVVEASNAVDGLKSDLSVRGGQCVISENGKQTATWWVNLTNILSIHHITIYYRTENEEWGPSNNFTTRFLGFSVYVSNTTDRLEGKLCFKDTIYNTSTIPSVFNTTCRVRGQYVIYYNERLTNVTYPEDYHEYAFNEICELEVYGCPTPGYYGINCSMPCPEQCPFTCHIEKGTCQGCKPGYRGHRCEQECFYGYFGQNCEQRCNDKCDGCNNANGVCDRGCQAGWNGDNCQQQCSYGFYGQNCEQRCDDKCTGCSSVNGTCDKGCNPGWKGDNCQQQCKDKKYGLNCSENCGNCRDLRQCHYINGSCLNGCSPGLQGEKCTMECAFGFYGIGCLQECSSFCKISHNCHPVTGFCKDGCKNGWQGNNCFEVMGCPRGSNELTYIIEITVACKLTDVNMQYDCVSKVENTDTDWKSKFNGMLGAFCVLLILTGCLIAYLLILTRRNKKRRTNQHQHDVSTKQGCGQYCEAHAGSGYNELSEYSTVPRTYQNLETY